MVKKIMIIVLLAYIGTALLIPETYESMTLWYKHGNDRLLLKAGQYSGMLAFALLNVQIILAVKGRLLTETFGPSKVSSYHRGNGVLIAFFALTHVLLVLIPEGLENLPLGAKFWPEMIGLILLLLILVTVLISKFRVQFRLRYSLWRTTHKIIGFGLIILLNIHVLFVSDTFEQSVPRVFLAITCLVVLGWIMIAKSTQK